MVDQLGLLQLLMDEKTVINNDYTDKGNARGQCLFLFQANENCDFIDVANCTKRQTGVGIFFTCRYSLRESYSKYAMHDYYRG